MIVHKQTTQKTKDVCSIKITCMTLPVNPLCSEPWTEPLKGALKWCSLGQSRCEGFPQVLIAMFSTVCDLQNNVPMTEAQSQFTPEGPAIGRLAVEWVVGLSMERPPIGRLDDVDEMLLMTDEADGVDAA